MDTNKIRQEMKNVRPVSLTGKFMAFLKKRNSPLLVNVADSPDFFVPVFTEVIDLHRTAAYLGYKEDEIQIKHIDDGPDFADSVFTAGLRIMLNPYIVDKTKTRWTEVIFDGPTES